jgi:hypothetical protein
MKKLIIKKNSRHNIHVYDNEIDQNSKLQLFKVLKAEYSQ